MKREKSEAGKSGNPRFRSSSLHMFSFVGKLGGCVCPCCGLSRLGMWSSSEGCG